MLLEKKKVNLMEKPAMKRTLTNRNIQLIALGGAIGTGLFLGSAKAIASAGPAVILVYLICGLAIYGLMRAMGDLFLANSTFNSISDFVDYYLGKSGHFCQLDLLALLAWSWTCGINSNRIVYPFLVCTCTSFDKRR